MDGWTSDRWRRAAIFAVCPFAQPQGRNAECKITADSAVRPAVFHVTLRRDRTACGIVPGNATMHDDDRALPGNLLDSIECTEYGVDGECI